MKTKTSAAHIVITDEMLATRPAPSPIAAPLRQPKKLSSEKVDAIFQKLREVEDRFGSKPDKNQLVIAMITVCIGGGFDTRCQIIAALVQQGRDRGHVAITLKMKAGEDPTRHLWHCNASVYRLYGFPELGICQITK